jgi:hypothetical protein
MERGNTIFFHSAVPDLPLGGACQMAGSGKQSYVVRRGLNGFIWTCSCPGWKFSKAPLYRRTCKHLKQLRGVENEQARLDGVNLWLTQPGRALKMAMEWVGRTHTTAFHLGRVAMPHHPAVGSRDRGVFNSVPIPRAVAWSLDGKTRDAQILEAACEQLRLTAAAAPSMSNYIESNALHEIDDLPEHRPGLFTVADAIYAVSVAADFHKDVELNPVTQPPLVGRPGTQEIRFEAVVSMEPGPPVIITEEDVVVPRGSSFSPVTGIAEDADWLADLFR